VFVFGTFSGVLLLMAIFGGLDKSGYNRTIARFMNIPVTKAACQPEIETWFGLYVFGCPATFLITLIALIKSRGQQNLHHYSLEAFYKEFLIYSNDNKAINLTILSIEVLHFLWSIAGSVLNSSVEHVTGGAIADCAYDYGFMTTIVAFTCLVMGYACVLRGLYYASHFVWHR